jgi:hypothetical protein
MGEVLSLICTHCGDRVRRLSPSRNGGVDGFREDGWLVVDEPGLDFYALCPACYLKLLKGVGSVVPVVTRNRQQEG